MNHCSQVSRSYGSEYEKRLSGIQLSGFDEKVKVGLDKVVDCDALGGIIGSDVDDDMTRRQISLKVPSCSVVVIRCVVVPGVFSLQLKIRIYSLENIVITRRTWKNSYAIP